VLVTEYHDAAIQFELGEENRLVIDGSWYVFEIQLKCGDCGYRVGLEGWDEFFEEDEDKLISLILGGLRELEFGEVSVPPKG